MKCEICKTKEAERRKNGKYKKTFMDTVEKYDYNGKFLCIDCRKEFEKTRKEGYKRKRELKHAPLSILTDLLSLKENEEWNLKLLDTEYYIKRIK